MPTPPSSQLLALARKIDPVRAEQQLALIGERAIAEPYVLGAATLLATAYPALAPLLESDPFQVPKPVRHDPEELPRLAAELKQLRDPDALGQGLRRFAQTERMRIALVELLPPGLGGEAIETTARQLSDLADITIDVALHEAERHAFAKFGEPRLPSGARANLVVLGMGKLGGRELNAGSDIDLVCFYDSDSAIALQGDTSTSAHALWTYVVKRMAATLDDMTEYGLVWRVDLRLRPEGSTGALANSLAAAERYYETFGRLWERAALLRARPVAGDLDLGQTLLHALRPFVWTRRIDPNIANTMHELVLRARASLLHDADRDLKLGPGGIREAEFAIQSLQLIWGGRDDRLRDPSTIGACHRLRGAGWLTEREAGELLEAYTALRRAEHFVQVASGIQTHVLPTETVALDRLGRALGFSDRHTFMRDLTAHKRRIRVLLKSLLTTDQQTVNVRWKAATGALDRNDLASFETALRAADMPGDDELRHLARDLFEIARMHPKGLLGEGTRERWPALFNTVLDAVADAADPVQAARSLRRFAARMRQPAIYAKLLADDPAATRRLVTVLGGSAFVGSAVAARPDHGDLVLFERALPTPQKVYAEVLLAAHPEGNDSHVSLEEQVGRLRRAKSRITTQVALADLAGEIDTRSATLTLTALADASLQAATRFALDTVPRCQPEPGIEYKDMPRGLAILAMGKLGGREIGYGSDLDVIFLFDPSAYADPMPHFSRAAKKIIKLISMPHEQGPGYELDPGLRPSGNQGMLVVSLEAFARYHHIRLAKDGTAVGAPGRRAATWERMALLRARFAAGDAALGTAAIAVAKEAAYHGGGDLAELARDVDRLRQRMEKERGRERPGRYDLKMGRGGLVDIEFAVQLLQLKNGMDPRVATTETRQAIEALARIGALDPEKAHALREGYAFLRKLEQRLRVLHGDAATLVEEHAAGLVPLARRMSAGGAANTDIGAALIEQYRSITGRVRSTYNAIMKQAQHIP